MKKQPPVSMIIPSYNRGETLCKTLGSLFRQNYSNFEIIVVDQSDKSFPEKEKFLKEHRAKIKYFRLFPPNASAARNFGVKKAEGEIILFLDDDVICDKGLVASHVAAYTTKKIGAVAGRVVTPNQKVETTRTNVGQISRLGRFANGFSSKIKQEVMTVITCNASWKKAVFEKIGGFDENFTGPIREDSDLSLRTIKAGYKIIFEPQALVIHKRAETGGFRKSEGRLKWYLGFFKSETYFFLKHLRWFWWPVFWLTRWQWFLCSRSLVTPFLGIYHGIKTYRRWKYENRG